MQLLGAVLARVDTLSRQVETAAAAAAAATAAVMSRHAAVVGDLCSTLRAYCALAALGRPVLRPQHVRAFITVPQCALRALLASHPSSSPPSAAAAGDTGKAVPAVRAAAAAVARLEEILLCTIVVTAGRLAITAEAVADGRSGRQHSGIFETEEDALSSSAGGTAGEAVEEMGRDKGAELEDGGRTCAMALGDLVKLSRSGNGVAVDGGGSGCYAALYGTLLLRGARLEALMDVVGDVLGVGVGPPLFSFEGVGERDVCAVGWGGGNDFCLSSIRSTILCTLLT